jgi:hypothetical protein
MSKSLAQQIVDSGSDPRELERLYRGNPKAFTAALPEARVIDHESIVLRVWEARLFLDRERAPIAAERQAGTDRTTIWLIIFLCAISGTIAKLPAFFPTINSNNYYSRDFAFFFLPAIAGYFATSSELRVKLEASGANSSYLRNCRSGNQRLSASLSAHTRIFRHQVEVGSV